MPLAVVDACPKAIPAKQTTPNKHNVIFIEFASDLEESRTKVRGDGLEFLLPVFNFTWTTCKPHTKPSGSAIKALRDCCGK
jgi:hypothetical protein